MTPGMTPEMIPETTMETTPEVITWLFNLIVLFQFYRNFIGIYGGIGTLNSMHLTQ